jgi:hypothetical protein
MVVKKRPVHVPNERIAWTAHVLALDVYHAWILSPSSRGVVWSPKKHSTAGSPRY